MGQLHWEILQLHKAEPDIIEVHTASCTFSSATTTRLTSNEKSYKMPPRLENWLHTLKIKPKPINIFTGHACNQTQFTLIIENGNYYSIPITIITTTQTLLQLQLHVIRIQKRQLQLQSLG